MMGARRTQPRTQACSAISAMSLRAARAVLSPLLMAETRPADSQHSHGAGAQSRKRNHSGRFTAGARARIEPSPSMTLKGVVLLLAVGAAVALVPLWAPLVMAAWTAMLARPAHERASRKLGGSQRSAAVLTVGFVLLGAVPLSVLGVSLTTRAMALGKRVMSSQDGLRSLLSMVNAEDTERLLPTSGELKVGTNQVIDFVREHGMGAWHALGSLAGATAAVLLGIFVFVVGFYTFLVDGQRAYGWLADHAPIERRHFHRLAQAFNETGRGLFIGVGLTAIGQGLLATIGYFALALPQAAVLGALTALAAFIPSAGAALVWIPVTAGLFIADRPAAGLTMLAIGAIVSTADNFARPMLSRFGQLRLPTFVLLIAMLGGMAAFGAWGLVLGPLFVRLTIEGLKILRDERQARHDATTPLEKS